MRFVLISLGFLGWAFYEMSGGADFDPSEVKAARLAVQAEKDAARAKAQAAAAAAAAVVETAEAPSAPAPADSSANADVTRVALNLTSLESPAQPAVAAQPVAQNAVVVTASADTPAIIPSLLTPGDASAAATDTVLRTVSGNRVNVRGGPGTDFGVVGRLVRGDQIRVLENNGAGWVRFEEADGTPGGWMAEFLLAGG